MTPSRLSAVFLAALVCTAGRAVGQRVVHYQLPREAHGTTEFSRLQLTGAVPVRLPWSRSEERRVGKSVDLGGRRIMKKKKTACDWWLWLHINVYECRINE